jgi:hypothetical protein
MRKHYKKIGRLLAVLVIDGLFFSLINPQKTHSVIIIVGFGLLVLTVYLGIDLLLGLLQRVMSFSAATRRRLQDASTMLIALLLAMQSIGQLTIRDLLALIPLVLVLAFYLSYQRKENA